MPFHRLTDPEEVPRKDLPRVKCRVLGKSTHLMWCREVYLRSGLPGLRKAPPQGPPMGYRQPSLMNRNQELEERRDAGCLLLLGPGGEGSRGPLWVNTDSREGRRSLGAPRSLSALGEDSEALGIIAQRACLAPENPK